MIRLRDLRIEQGTFRLEGLNLEIETPNYITLMGETGSGKTTIVECICGLRPIVSGSISINGRLISASPMANRQIGYVPQDHVLFPGMKVRDQIEYGLKVRRVSKQGRQQRVDELANLMSIHDLLERRTNGLSGGEKQRIALARALAIRPQLLLLDEPLASLDQTMKSEMTELLKSIYEHEALTILHITHDRHEAVELGSVHVQLANGQLMLQ